MTARVFRWTAAPLAAVALIGPTLRGETAVSYRFTFPEPEHHWMAVDASFSGLTGGPLELRMSRSSPGRYSLHDFAKNVYGVQATGSDGARLPITRPDSSGWTIPTHTGTVTVHYKVFGDVIDGTYLSIDRSHAHLNMPASILWARGLDDRPVQLTFVVPEGSRWRAVSQLSPAGQPFAFTAPNLQYLMDSPVELGPVAVRLDRRPPVPVRRASHGHGQRPRRVCRRRRKDRCRGARCVRRVPAV
jgi:predicted metalloprotease with PDZ domain